MKRLLALGLIVVLAACDTPDPLQPTNPYDPDKPVGRIATPPSELAVSETTPTSVTLTWTDNSSFESGYHVVEVIDVVGAPPRESVVAELPPDASSYVIEDLLDVEPHRFVVRAVTDPGPPTDAPDAVSNAVEVHYPPLSQAALSTSDNLSFSDVIISGDGSTVFVYSSAFSSQTQTVETYDVLSGQRIAQGAFAPFSSGGDPNRLMPIYGGRAGVGGNRYNEARLRFEGVVSMVSRAGVVETRELSQAHGCERFVANPEGTVVAGFCFPQQEGQGEMWRAWSLSTGDRVGQLREGDRAYAESLLALTATQALFATDAGLELVRGVDGEVVWQQPLSAPWAQFLDGQQKVIVSLFEGQRPILRVLSATTGERLVEWSDPLEGPILATRGTRAVYLIDEFPSIGGYEGVVVDIESPETRRVLSGAAGGVKAAHFTDDTVVTVGGNGRIYEWDFSQPWEVVSTAE
ncbi:MAG: hypothetical protein Rubg2KO_22690 [Rubricoccaceae bacterium]